MIRNICRNIGILSLIAGSLPISSFSYEMSADAIYKHISVLADDSLEGREVGEIGEWKSAQYIAEVFRQAGLQPGGDANTYLQAFDFIKKIEFGPGNQMTVNGVALKLFDEFQPMHQSASETYLFKDIVDVGYGITVESEDGTYDDYGNKDVAGKAVLIRRYTPSKDEYPHDNFEPYESLTSKIQGALNHNAAGIIMITPPDQDDTLPSFGPVRVTPKEIPILFLRRAGLERLGLSFENPAITTIDGQIELIKVRDTGFNVVGLLPAVNDTTILVGAHYDHLGWGGSASRYLDTIPMIHNGADDNGSGTAVLLELARYFAANHEAMRYSLRFIAFSGEEAGILGSSHYSKNLDVDSSLVRMMVNMDMIGRLRDQEKGLAIFGTGTCEAFKSYFDTLAFTEFKIVQKEEGTGPTDHTSFYNRGIPVLSFFTGAHEDYHKPSDDIDKIDFPNTFKVAQLVARIIEDFDHYPGQLVFQRTKAPENTSMSTFSVTLGIMPDYVAEVKGLRIDNVSPNRPGDRAGLLAGDVIIQMGTITVGDIYDYMNALSKFRKGDSTSVVIERGSDTLSVPVTFQ